MKRKPSIGLLLCAAAGGVISGCVPPGATTPVAQFQQEATLRLTERYAQDLAVLRSLLTAVLDIREETLRVEIEGAILARYVAPSGDADVGALNIRLQAPPTNDPDPIVSEVRSGRMSADDAARWLEDFALAWRLHHGVEVRARLIAQLKPMKSMQIARDELLRAIDAHAAGVARLAADANASSAALARAHDLQREFTEPGVDALGRFWRETVLAEVRDPASRDLIQTILTMVAPSLAAADTEMSQ